MNSFEIYFSDLTEEAQKRLLEAAGLDSHKEANWDTLPVTTIDFYNEE